MRTHLQLDPALVAEIKSVMLKAAEEKYDHQFTWAYSTATSLLFPALKSSVFSSLRKLDVATGWQRKFQTVREIWQNYKGAPRCVRRSNEFRYRRAYAIWRYWKMVVSDSPPPDTFRSLYYCETGCSQAHGCNRYWLCPVCYAYQVVYPTLYGVSVLFDINHGFGLNMRERGVQPFLFADVQEESCSCQDRPLLDRARDLEVRLATRFSRRGLHSAGELSMFSYYTLPGKHGYRLGCRMSGLILLHREDWPKAPCSIEPLFTDMMCRGVERSARSASDAISRRLPYPYWATELPTLVDFEPLYRNRQSFRATGLLRGYRTRLKTLERDYQRNLTV
jgi:hypothetical protein